MDGLPSPNPPEENVPEGAWMLRKFGGMAAWQWALIVVVILAIGGSAVGRAVTSEAETPPTLPPAPPDGYTFGPFLGGGVAFKFLEADDCTYYDFCANVELYAVRPCPGGVYIEANLLDREERIVDWTNDAVNALPLDGRAVVTLGWFESGVDAVQITKLSCS